MTYPDPSKNLNNSKTKIFYRKPPPATKESTPITAILSFFDDDNGSIPEFLTSTMDFALKSLAEAKMRKRKKKKKKREKNPPICPFLTKRFIFWIVCWRCQVSFAWVIEQSNGKHGRENTQHLVINQVLRDLTILHGRQKLVRKKFRISHLSSKVQ